MIADMSPHQGRTLFSAQIERTVKVPRARVMPIRLGVAEQAEAFQTGFSLFAGFAETPVVTRCKASSSVSRMTGVPGGKAESRRLGKAAESITKCP